MMYFWLIPVVLLAALVLTLFFKEGTRRNPVSRSSLDEAEALESNEGGLRK
jgi:hypothetical protein